VHPNDHANLSQSSNDGFPTAMQVAAVRAIQDQLLPAVRALRQTLTDKSVRLADVVKLGRTHLQDATPITLGQEISGWAAQLEAALDAVAATLPALSALPIGGTAVGTGLNAHREFGERAVREIATLSGVSFSVAANRFAGIAAHDACVGTSGALRQLAVACMKIANDVRWLASGPRAGLGEISLPINEPGSSIMPGKVNPTQCEALCMVACQVMGNDVAIGIAGSQGNFELNVYKPVIAYNLLQSIRLLADACASFDLRCARGIEPQHRRLQENLERSLMLVTALTPHLGYDAAAAIAHHAHAHELSLRAAAAALGVLSEERFDELVRPAEMVGPTRSGED
jgi:fumarate hydratase class II